MPGGSGDDEGRVAPNGAEVNSSRREPWVWFARTSSPEGAAERPPTSFASSELVRMVPESPGLRRFLANDGFHSTGYSGLPATAEQFRRRHASTDRKDCCSMQMHQKAPKLLVVSNLIVLCGRTTREMFVRRGVGRSELEVDERRASSADRSDPFIPDDRGSPQAASCPGLPSFRSDSFADIAERGQPLELTLDGVVVPLRGSDQTSPA